MKVLVTQSCQTLTPWTIACQAPLSMEFSGKEYQSGLLIPSLGITQSRDRTQVSCITGGLFTA